MTLCLLDGTSRTAEQLAADLAALERSRDAIETIVAVTSYYPVFDQRENREIHRRLLVHRTGRDGLVRNRYFPLAPHEVPDMAMSKRSPSFINTWTGDAFVRHIPGRQRVSIYRRPKLKYFSDCDAYFNGNDWPGLGGHAALSHLLHSSRVIEESHAGGVHRFVLLLDPNSPSVIELVFEDDTWPQVSSVTIETRSSTPAAESSILHARYTYSVTEWSEFDGQVMPSRARRVAEVVNVEGLEPHRGLVVFERLHATPGRSFRDGDEEREFAWPDVSDGYWVADQRAHLSYSVGANRALIDGAAVSFSEDLNGYVLDMLPGLGLNARAGVSRSSNSDSAVARTLPAVAAGILGFVVMIAYKRISRSRKCRAA